MSCDQIYPPRKRNKIALSATFVSSATASFACLFFLTWDDIWMWDNSARLEENYDTMIQ